MAAMQLSLEAEQAGFSLEPKSPGRYISNVTGYEVNLATATIPLLHRLVQGGDPYVIYKAPAEKAEKPAPPKDKK